jgi:hypothetical protein
VSSGGCSPVSTDRQALRSTVGSTALEHFGPGHMQSHRPRPMAQRCWQPIGSFSGARVPVDADVVRHHRPAVHAGAERGQRRRHRGRASVLPASSSAASAALNPPPSNGRPARPRAGRSSPTEGSRRRPRAPAEERDDVTVLHRVHGGSPPGTGCRRWAGPPRTTPRRETRARTRGGSTNQIPAARAGALEAEVHVLAADYPHRHAKEPARSAH